MAHSLFLMLYSFFERMVKKISVQQPYGKAHVYPVQFPPFSLSFFSRGCCCEAKRVEGSILQMDFLSHTHVSDIHAGYH